MSGMLPTIEAPTYEIKLPTNGKKVKYRPFLVREEKILMMAETSDDDNEIMVAVKQILENCTFGKIDVDNMALLDLEYMFLQIRIRSKGETSKLAFKCKNVVPNTVDGEDGIVCDHVNKVTIDLTTIQPENKKVEQTIAITENIGVKMKPISIETSESIIAVNTSEDSFNILASLIESIYSGDEVWLADKVVAEEIIKFLDQFTESQIKKLLDYVREYPTLKTNIDVKCPKCGNEKNIELKGLRNFFA